MFDNDGVKQLQLTYLTDVRRRSSILDQPHRNTTITHLSIFLDRYGCYSWAPSNACKHGRADVKTMTMMIFACTLFQS